MLTSHFLGNHLTLNQNFTPQSRPFSPKSKPYSPQSGPKFNPSNPSDNSSHSFTPKPNFSGENKGQSPLSQPICNYCKQSGHIISECVALKSKREKEKQKSPKPTGLTSLRLKPQSSIQDGNSCGVSSDLDGYRGALKREVFFHTFFCVLVRICNQTSSNQHLLVVGC